MHLPPPIRLKRQLNCPSCGQLTPIAGNSCIHCDGGIPDRWRREESRRLDKRRRRAWIASAIGLPLLLLLFTLVFHSCGSGLEQTVPLAAERAADLPLTTTTGGRPVSFQVAMLQRLAAVGGPTCLSHRL